jgi:hypothetical protein
MERSAEIEPWAEEVFDEFVSPEFTVPEFVVIVAPPLLNCDALSVEVPAPAPVDRIVLGEKVVATAKAACSTSCAALAAARKEGFADAGEVDGGA